MKEPEDSLIKVEEFQKEVEIDQKLLEELDELVEAAKKAPFTYADFLRQAKSYALGSLNLSDEMKKVVEEHLDEKYGPVT